jgi:hypothetical protein
MHSEIRVIHGIDVLAKRCEEASNVGWTTGDPKPFFSVMRTQAGQGVLIEELLAVK